MNHAATCENHPKRTAGWKCEYVYFCEECKEDLILRVGVDRFKWTRLDVPEIAFELTKNAGSRLNRVASATRSRNTPYHSSKDKKNERSETGVSVISDIRFPDGIREVCRTYAAWEKRRKYASIRANSRCEECGGEAPIHSRTLPAAFGDMPKIVRAGEAHHIIPRGLAGCNRDDRHYNLLWVCCWCHDGITDGKFVPHHPRVREARSKVSI